MKYVMNYSASKEKPLEIEITSNNVYLRKNITRSEISNMWSFSEAVLTREEYDDFKKQLESSATIAIMQMLTEIQLRIDELEVAIYGAQQNVSTVEGTIRE